MWSPPSNINEFIRRYLSTRGAFRLFIRSTALLIGVACAYLGGVLIDSKHYWWAVLPYVFILAAAVLEFVFGDVLTEYKYPLETQKRLSLFDRRVGDIVLREIHHKLQIAIDSLRACNKTKVRAAVHLLVEVTAETSFRREFRLFQVTEYVNGTSGPRGRFTSLDQGIIGRCARTGKPEAVNFSSVDEYERRMVREFGYSQGEMQSHSKRSRSYLAYPLMRDGGFVGVLYFDSEEIQVFPLCAQSASLHNLADDLAGLLRTAGVV